MDHKPTDTHPADGRSPRSDAFLYGLGAVCVLLFLGDFLYHKHGYFEIEELPGFYAIIGFLSCGVLAVLSGVLRNLLTRPEDYYAPRDIDAEAYPEAGTERADA